MEKYEFRMFIKHCFLMAKILCKQSNGLISVIRTLFRRKQRLRGGTLILNPVVQKQMMLNALVIQIQHLSRKTATPHTFFGRWLIEVAWDSRGAEDIRRQCIHHIAWIFVNEKAVFKVGAAFAHSRSKTTMRQRFRALFATVSMQQKRIFA